MGHQLRKKRQILYKRYSARMISEQDDETVGTLDTTKFVITSEEHDFKTRQRIRFLREPTKII